MSKQEPPRYVRKGQVPGEQQRRMNESVTREEIKQRRRKNRRRRQIISVIILIILALLIARCSAVGLQMVRPADAGNDTTTRVEIPIGSTVNDIGQILEEEKIIKNAKTFKLYCKIRGEGADFNAGVYAFSPSMRMKDITAALNEGASHDVLGQLVVREGVTVDDIAAEVEASSNSLSERKFLSLMNDQGFLKTLQERHPWLLDDVLTAELTRYPLEGYLFPATYDITEGTDEAALIEAMVQKTEDILLPRKDDIAASGHTVRELLTMASLVEKEGNNAEDRHKIAGVFYNRLNMDMAIQSDISILYALGTHKELVTYKDLEVDSPYNLYTHTGLGPGPFNNPGEEAIDAALNPAETDAIYFIADLSTGKVYFTADYNQHLAWQKELNETGGISG